MNKERPIKVMIVDDHAVVRSGLSAFLMAYDDLELVGEASGGKEAVSRCREVSPDVVLMDLVMPEMDGAQTTEEILKTCPDIKVVALTSFPEEDLVQKALKAGAISYLLKNVSGDELADAIRAAYAGKATLAPEATEALIHSATKPPAPGQDLTERELEILTLMTKGLNNDTIAKELFISTSTVKFHVSNVLMKLGAATRTEAVAIALQNNLVERK
jgi:two-component system, NarL family, response regulator LiaR